MKGKAKKKSAIKLSIGDRIVLCFIYVIVTILVLLVLYPLIFVISSSFSDPVAVASGEVWLWPVRPTLEGYIRVFQEPTIITGYLNTIYYTVVGTLINLIVTVPCGYALSKSSLPGRGFVMGGFMFTMYVSGGMIPTYLLIQKLGLYNTRAVLLITGAFSVYNCIICRTFFSGLPRELEEAAAIDGCSPFRCFLQIVLPTSQALLGVMVLYFAIGHWNSYFGAMMYINKQEYKPLQLVLRKILIESQNLSSMLEGSGAEEYATEMYKTAQLLKYAVIVVSSVPVMILYPFLQKYFAKGVMIGSVKG